MSLDSIKELGTPQPWLSPLTLWPLKEFLVSSLISSSSGNLAILSPESPGTSFTLIPFLISCYCLTCRQFWAVSVAPLHSSTVLCLAAMMGVRTWKVCSSALREVHELLANIKEGPYEGSLPFLSQVWGDRWRTTQDEIFCVHLSSWSVWGFLPKSLETQLWKQPLRDGDWGENSRLQKEPGLGLTQPK